MEIGYLLIWQLSPAYPGRQLQTYPLTLSTHVPPFTQGLLEHSLKSERKEIPQFRDYKFFNDEKRTVSVKRNVLIQTIMLHMSV